MQQWKDIPGFEIFQVSNIGNVRRKESYLLKGKKIVRVEAKDIKKLKVKGYYYADMNCGGIRWNARICRLVATCFLRKPKPGEVVNHRDCNKLNDSVDNLEWCTAKENAQHAKNNGLLKLQHGELSAHSKLRDKDIMDIFKLRSEGMYHRQIATIKGIGVSTVTHILLGTRWPHLKKKAEALYGS